MSAKIFSLFITVMSFCNFLQAQNSTLPKEIKFSGKIKYKQIFTDTLGQHILISSATEGTRNKNDEGYAYVFVYDYLKTPSSYTYVLNWKLEDGISACIVDYEAAFLAEPTITDLDKNGIKEITMVYKQTCRGDVSPDEMKVIMRENKNKYGLRGSNFDQTNSGKSTKRDPCCTDKYNKDDYLQFEGRYANENDFKNAPKSFLENARKIWIKYR